MASSSEQAHLAKGVKVYMGQIAEWESSRHDKNIAGSSELKQFLLYLAERAPQATNKVLKLVSQKCDATLRAEKEAQMTRKRTEPPNSDESNAKRSKIAGPTDEDTDSSEPVTESEKTVHVRDHMRRPPQKDGQKGGEDEDEEEDNDDAGLFGNNLSSVRNMPVRATKEREVILSPTPYQIEVGLPMRRPDIEARVKAHCLRLKPQKTRPKFDIHHEIDDMLDKCRLLEFYKVRQELRQYLEDRAKMPGKKLLVRTNWNMSNPGEILDALQTIKTNTFDAKIHRAFGQTMLFSSVSEQVAQGYKSSVKGHLYDHTEILEELALKKAGPVSHAERKRMIDSYLHEYHAGKRWKDVIDGFEGSGIVLVFVTARIGTWFVEAGWTNFQRDCLQYIAEILRSIRRMVESMGSEALKVYCENGCLDTDCIERVKESRFTQPDGDDAQPASDEESGDESRGDDALPAGDGELGDESGGDDAQPAGDGESEDEDGDNAQPASDEESD